MRKALVTGIVCLLVGAGVGAGLMWLVDPRGRADSKAQAKPSNPVDPQGLQDLRRTLGETFLWRDAKRVADWYAEDAELIEPTGETFKGRAAIEKRVADLLDPGDDPFGRNIQVKAAMTGERFVTPEVVVEDGTWEMTGRKKTVGTPGIATKAETGRYTIIIVYRDGQWRVASHRSWVPVAPDDAKKN